MTTSSLLSRFTPSRTDPDVLESIFVQRQELAKFAEERIQASATGCGRHHLLLVGPRGSGKTHFVSLIFHRLGLREDLRDRLRVAWLLEDETSSSFAKLLLRIHRALRERYPGEFPPPDMDTLGRLDPAARNELLVRRLVERLVGRTLLVIVENLDELFKGLGDDGQKEFRAFLQEHAVATMLATSQQLFAGVASREWPFFGFFEIEHLKPLGVEDAVLLLRKIAVEVKHDPELASFLQTPTGRDRVRAIHHLSGGNHRIYIVLSDFITRESLDELVGPFEKMLDELTPYYQARLNWLSPQQREIVEFLCRTRRAVAVKAIAAELFLTQQVVASQLKDIKEKGYVKSATVGREARYELAEPLMRLCVEMKENHRRPIRLFVDFLRAWYSRDQLEHRLAMLPPHAPIERLYLEHTLRAIQETPSDPVYVLENLNLDHLFATDPDAALHALEVRATGRGQFEDWILLGVRLINLQRYERALPAIEEALTLAPYNPTAWHGKGVALGELGRPEESLICYDRALAIRPDHPNAWYNKGVTLGELGRPEESLDCYDRALAIEPDDPSAWNNKGVALRKLGRLEESLACSDRALVIKPDHPRAWYNKAIALGELGRLEESLGCSDRALAIKPDDLGAWYNKAIALRELGRLEESLTAFEQSAAIDPNWGLLHLLRSEVLFTAHDWEKGFDALRLALQQSLTDSDFAEADFATMIQVVLTASKDRAFWGEQIQHIVSLFAGATALTYLGSCLVRSLKRLPDAGLDDEALAAWGEVWHDAGDGHEEMLLPLRLFGVGLRYDRTKDRRVLLDLISEERSLLEQVLGLEAEDLEGVAR